MTQSNDDESTDESTLFELQVEDLRAVTEVMEWWSHSHGEYRQEPGPDYLTIDRKERGDWTRNEYRYFVAEDYHENREQTLDSYERVEKISDGEIQMLAIHGELTLSATHESGDVFTKTYTSKGITHVPSDGERVIREHAIEEMCEVCRMANHHDCVSQFLVGEIPYLDEKAEVCSLETI